MKRSYNCDSTQPLVIQDGVPDMWCCFADEEESSSEEESSEEESEEEEEEETPPSKNNNLAKPMQRLRIQPKTAETTI